MKTENELIAEFMGEVITGVTANYNQPVEVYVLPKKPMGRKTGRAIKVGYDTSWDWLIPVVEKIEKLYAQNVDQFNKPLGCQKEAEVEYRNVLDQPIYVGIQQLHFLVVKFIKWHNENIRL